RRSPDPPRRNRKPTDRPTTRCSYPPRSSTTDCSPTPPTRPTSPADADRTRGATTRMLRSRFLLCSAGHPHPVGTASATRPCCAYGSSCALRDTRTRSAPQAPPGHAALTVPHVLCGAPAPVRPRKRHPAMLRLRFLQNNPDGVTVVDQVGLDRRYPSVGRQHVGHSPVLPDLTERDPRGGHQGTVAGPCRRHGISRTLPVGTFGLRR